jgi:hypothetical protein
MVDHRVGVREAERVVLHEVNEEFFDSVWFRRRRSFLPR